jgi:hypothetical protein
MYRGLDELKIGQHKLLLQQSLGSVMEVENYWRLRFQWRGTAGCVLQMKLKIGTVS